MPPGAQLIHIICIGAEAGGGGGDRNRSVCRIVQPTSPNHLATQEQQDRYRNLAEAFHMLVNL